VQEPSNSQKFLVSRRTSLDLMAGIHGLAEREKDRSRMETFADHGETTNMIRIAGA
jgi:hypothetical protein